MERVKVMYTGNPGRAGSQASGGTHSRHTPGSLPSDCRDLPHRARLALAQARARAPPRGAHSHSLATHSLASRARAAAQQARARAWTTDSRTASSSDLSTSDGSVSSSSTLGPWRSGPNAQIERAASRSQSYFCCAARAHSARLRPGRFSHVAFVTRWPGAQHGCRAALGRWAWPPERGLNGCVPQQRCFVGRAQTHLASHQLQAHRNGRLRPPQQFFLVCFLSLGMRKVAQA